MNMDVKDGLSLKERMARFGGLIRKELHPQQMVVMSKGIMM